MSVSYQVRAYMEEAVDSSKQTLDTISTSRRIIVRQPATNVARNKKVTLEKDITTMFFIK